MKKLIIITICFTLSGSFLYSQVADSPWPMYRHDINHSARSTFNGPENPKIKWEIQNQYSTNFLGVIIGPDETIYTSDFHHIYSFDKSGTNKWTYSDVGNYPQRNWGFDGTFLGQISLGKDGNLYFVNSLRDSSHGIYSISNRGVFRWKQQLQRGGEYYGPTLGPDNNLYVSFNRQNWDDGGVVAIDNNTGLLKWRFSFIQYGYDHEARGPVSVEKDSIIYACADNRLFGIDQNGIELFRHWNSEMWGGALTGPPCISGDGSICARIHDRRLISLNSDRTFNWKIEGGGLSLPAISKEGIVYFCSSEDKFYAINTDGSIKWEIQHLQPYDFKFNPIVDGNGTIYIGTFDGKLRAINQNGTPKWELDLGGKVQWISIGYNNTLYVCTDAGKLYAIGDSQESQISVTLPVGGEIWIVDEKHNITWSSENVENVKSEYSIDNGNTWKAIFNSIPASNGIYEWTIPNEKSKQCKIKISDVDNPDVFDESEIFKINGYILARLIDDQYELFDINKHAWSFGNNETRIESPYNSSPILWPYYWWIQFNYTSDFYPYLWRYWTISIDFPNWLLYPEVFGEENCYKKIGPFRWFKKSAVDLWKRKKEPWDGSCFGFAVSCFLAFHNKTQFLSKFNSISDFQDLRELEINNEIRSVINHLYCYQWGKHQMLHQAKNIDKSPTKVLEELKALFINDDEPRFLYINNQTESGGSHAVNPFKIEKDKLNTDLENIYVYDNNFPNTIRKIQIHKSLDAWTYAGYTGFGSGCYLSEPISEYYENPDLPIISSGDNNLSKKSMNAEDYLTIFNIPFADIEISDENENELSYRDSVVTRTIDNSIPITPIIDKFHPPIGYFLPNRNYKININNFSDSTSYLTIVGNSIIYDFERHDADNHQNDNFEYSDYLKIYNKDLINKVFNFRTIKSEGDIEKVIMIEKCSISQNDEINFKLLKEDMLQIINIGLSKTYNLNIEILDNTGYSRFDHENIELKTNSTQKIVPKWDDIENEPIKILIDNNNDGLFDDSLFFNNQFVSIKNNKVSQIPEEYFLTQNYPNPFNPSTNITFGLPKDSYVKIEIYNIHGQKVKTLLDYKLSVGNHIVKFDARDFPSGLYFYIMKTENYIETKKMIFIK